MHINFAPKDEAYLKSLVEDGYYTNVAEAIRDAVRRMRETYRSEYHNPMYDAVMKAERNLASGAPTTRYNSALMEHLIEEATASAERGEPVSPDVIPQ